MKTLLILVCGFWGNLLIAQNQNQEIFQKISSTLKDFKVNRNAVPEDKLTQEIRKLRETKGGFNINEAILFKIGEDQQKGDLKKEEAEKEALFFRTGKGKTDLDHAVIWIYRDLFTLAEIRKLTKFYKSSAGHKLSENFPIIMVKSLKASEEIMKDYKNAN